MRTTTGSVLLSALCVALLSTAAPSPLLAQKQRPKTQPTTPKKTFPTPFPGYDPSTRGWTPGPITRAPGSLLLPIPGSVMPPGRFGDFGPSRDFGRAPWERETVPWGRDRFFEDPFGIEDPFSPFRIPGGPEERLLDPLNLRQGRTLPDADTVVNQILRAEQGRYSGMGWMGDAWMPGGHDLPPEIVQLLRGTIPSLSMGRSSIWGGGSPLGHRSIGGFDLSLMFRPGGRGGYSLFGPSLPWMEGGAFGMPSFPGLHPQRMRSPGYPMMPSMGGITNPRRYQESYLDRMRSGRVVPQPPSKDEQRAALKKLRQGLETVEGLAKKELWGLLSVALEKQEGLSSLPSHLAESIRSVQAEASLLARLTDLRRSVTTPWNTAPDADALEQHLAAVRSATGDRALTDHLRRLLAVKAAWEGHDQTARSLGRGAEALDVDAELVSLRRSLAEAGRPAEGNLVASTRTAPIASDEERDDLCRQAARSLLFGIDQHLDAGRFTAAAHGKSIASYRGAVGKAIRKLDGDSSSPTDGNAEQVAQDVAKALGRKLTEVDRLVLMRMHTAGKTVEEITRVLK